MAVSVQHAVMAACVGVFAWQFVISIIKYTSGNVGNYNNITTN